MLDLQSRVSEALGHRYRIERKLGEGGMAVVFLAHDLKHHRSVALKVLKPEVAAATARQRFLREIEIAANLSHPNILPLYDSGHRDDLVYYVMPYVEGESLAERLRRERQLPFQDAIRIACEVAEALDHAHAHDVIHRDIKPSNILLSEGHALVVDFGIARALSESDGETLTQAGIAIGTPAYMSPEQAAGDARVDGRSDLYALGCVLYQMLAGEPPFDGATPQAVLAKHVSQPVPSLRSVRHAVPDEVELAVETALQKLPADRFSTGSEFARVLQGRDTATMLVTRARRRRAALGAIRLSLPLLAAAAVLLIWSPWDRGVPRATAPPGVRQIETDRLRRIAILFFDAEGGNPELRRFADELTRALIGRFRLIPSLETKPELVVRDYRESGDLPDSIARWLDVGMLAHGFVTQTGDSLRVSSVLMGGGRRTALEQVDLPIGPSGVLELVTPAADRLDDRLRGAVYEELQRLEAWRETQSEEARRRVEFAEGLADEVATLMGSGKFKEAAAELARADSSLMEASRYDSRWIEPYLRRAKVARNRAFVSAVLAGGPGSDSTRAGLEAGVSLVDQALSINPLHPRALARRCTLLDAQRVLAPPEERFGTFWNNVLRACMDAVGRKSDLHEAWATLAGLYYGANEFEMARERAERALREDVFRKLRPENLSTLAMATFELGEDREALARCREGMERHRAPYMFLDCELAVRAYGDSIPPDPDAAWDLYDRFVSEVPPGAARPSEQLARVATVLARAGLRDSANAVIDRLLEEELAGLAEAADLLRRLLAVALAQTGRIEEALEQLRLYLHAEPVAARRVLARRMFTPLRRHPEFEVLLRD